MSEGDRSLTVEIAFDDNSAFVIETQRGPIQAEASRRGFSDDATDKLSTYFDAVVDSYALAATCAESVSYPGAIEARPTAPESPFGFSGVNPAASSGIAVTFAGPDSAADEVLGDEPLFGAADREDGRLANSGSESFVLVYFGVGMLAFGATALGMRRWMSGPYLYDE